MEKSVPLRIQSNILNLIDKVDLFDGVNEDLLYILEKIQIKEPKKNN